MKWMPTCRDVAGAVSRDERPELSPGRRLQMRLHLFMCSDCRRYVRQLQAIGRSARELNRVTDIEPERLQSLEAAILEDLAGGSGRSGSPNSPDSPDE